MNEPMQVNSIVVLNRKVLQLCFLNLFIVTLSGLFLRSIPVFNLAQISFINLLHGHSHFAFGGWLTPVIIWMLVQYFPELQKAGYKNWRNVFVMLFFSAYGMLATFPFEGYGTSSIFFSSLSVAGTFYFSFIAWKALQGRADVPSKFLRSAIIFLTLSALGPFATGPLKALGFEGSVLYYDAVYFYLHFQYNGWFTFAILSILFQRLHAEEKTRLHSSFYYFLFGCLLTFFLSVLWSKPHFVFNLLGASGALLQLVGCYFLVKNLWRTRHTNNLIRFIEGLAVIAFVLKLIFQLFSALPYVVQLTLQNRNLLISYLHLVMLGFITFFVFATVINNSYHNSINKFRFPVIVFLSAFVLSELILVFGAWSAGNFVLDFHLLMFVTSCGFPFSTFIIFRLMATPSIKANRQPLILQQ